MVDTAVFVVFTCSMQHMHMTYTYLYTLFVSTMIVNITHAQRHDFSNGKNTISIRNWE